MPIKCLINEFKVNKKIVSYTYTRLQLIKVKYFYFDKALVKTVTLIM